MIASDVIDAARQMVGTPFRHQGRIPGVALDCAGLVVAVARQLGLDPQTPEDYGRTPANGLLEATLDGEPCLQRIYPVDRQPGDILLMRFSREPQHVAILASDTIIHSYSAVGRVVEHRIDAQWESRIVRVYRFRGVAP